MNQAKKVEIIIESIHLAKIVRIMDELNLPGYSIIHEVTGHGSHGDREAEDQITQALSNSYIIAICSDKQATELAEQVAPKLKKFGGVCCISSVVTL
ncbi:MAG: hypothetical protein WD449_03200 [Candidatus Babeliales bacterium]